ncbi:MAG: hypothetical protein EAX96_04595 [Candidatus Lokiarchaeota archaeon]|nr:hypothetical protein [Candidatus Lokiarchaeota archaeon]
MILSALLVFLSFSGNNAIIIEEAGFLTITWTGLFNIIAISFYFFMAFILAFFGIKLFYHSPYELKKESKINLLGSILAGPVNISLYAFTLIEPIFIYLADSIFVIGLILITFIIIKEPKILYILPFIPYNLIILNSNKEEVFNQIWTQSKENQLVLKEFLKFAEKITDTKDPNRKNRIITIDMNFSTILINVRMNYMICLAISNSSKLVKQLLLKFSDGFEFQIRSSSISEVNFLLLMDKYFSIFPSRLITSKNQSLLFSPDHVKIPPELDEKLKEIIKDEDEYKRIKCDYQRSPKSVSKEFLELYEELKDQTD